MPALSPWYSVIAPSFATMPRKKAGNDCFAAAALDMDARFMRVATVLNGCTRTQPPMPASPATVARVCVKGGMGAPREFNNTGRTGRELRGGREILFRRHGWSNNGLP